ncbi:MAG: ribonucleoside-diphosphate reductase subunit alpha, partial [Myxococcota bacterium]
SLNLFMETPTIGKLSSMYMYAWEQGIKTTYYLRSRPATRIKQTSAGGSAGGAAGNGGQGPSIAAAAKTPGELAAMAATSDGAKKEYSEDEVIACSLENPEYCEACQ